MTQPTTCYQKAVETILTDFRDGQIGCITLETPNQWESWLKTARQKEAELKAAREARKLERKGQKLCNRVVNKISDGSRK